MKRFFYLFSLLVLISISVPAKAVDFQVQIEPGKTFTHPDAPFGTYLMGNTSMYLDILMGNNSGSDIAAFSQTLRFYSTNGDGTYIYWIEVGGSPETYGSLERINGWEDATYWNIANAITIFSWDGFLPDTINHTAVSTIGWPDGDPTQSRLRFHFNVPVAGIDPLSDIVEICVEQSDTPDPYYDWLFPDGSQFGGPYCFEFLGVVTLPPYILGCPTEMTTSHDVPYDITLGIDNPLEDPVTNVGAVDENWNPIGTVTYIPGASSFQWVFLPPCEWLYDGLTHTVKFYLESNYGGQHYPNVTFYPSTLNVTEGTPPEISGACNEQWFIAINYQWTFDFDVINQSSENINWSYSVSPSAPQGDVELIDGVLTFRPCPADEIAAFFNFAVRATDCTGAYDECNIECEVGSMRIADPNFDQDWEILDVIYVINHLYKDGPLRYAPFADWNWDGTVNILDVIYMINFLYKDGSYPIFPSSC